ncbi:MAG: hypothetical protein PHX49_09005, partial [Bacteroidales bacterium]|nr:hypothetical protein [Bacteroidales bacterium]
VIHQFDSFSPIINPVVNYTMNIPKAKAEFSEKVRNASERMRVSLPVRNVPFIATSPTCANG